MKLSWKRARRLCVGIALSVAVVLTPTMAHAAPPPATAASSAGWNDYSCTPSPEHPHPVVLVHGTFGNATSNWLGLAPYLVDRGHCVFSLDYGKLPGVPLFHGLGPIEESAAELAGFIDEVLAATGAPEVDLVGHSQGGMMPRYYLKHHPDGADKVGSLIGIAPNTNGTTLLGLTRLLDFFPGVGDLIGGGAPALTQQIAGSEFITALNEDGYTVEGVDYTVIATRYDEVVTPYRTQFIEEPGVNNVLVQDLCPVDLSEHLAIALADRVAFHEVANALDPANAVPTTCRALLP